MISKEASPMVELTRKRIKHAALDSLLRYAEFLGYGDIHTKIDRNLNFMSMIAVHNLRRGPAIGGCRMVSYRTMDKALEDVLRLGHMMSYKAAINKLAHGGAKAVIIKPDVINNREALFEKFGEFVHELGGRYITAVDSGTSMADMDIIARKTSYVTCTTKSGVAGDPSPLTALGVRRGIEAAVKFKMGRESLEGVHVAIQGAGHVGYFLCKELHALGAKITMTDVNPTTVERCVKEFGIKICHPNDIFHLEADVFAPCALGAILNLNTIKQLRVKIVAGSANNQLSHQHNGTLLHERGILYAPDFLINAGGLIQVAVIYDHGDMQKAHEQIRDIYGTAYDIFERSTRENRATNKIAEEIARERLR